MGIGRRISSVNVDGALMEGILFLEIVPERGIAFLDFVKMRRQLVAEVSMPVAEAKDFLKMGLSRSRDLPVECTIQLARELTMC